MGPLKGVRIIEMAGIGPGPFCCMLLSDLGAEVIRIDRAKGGMVFDHAGDILNRGRKSIVVDLKQPEGVEVVLKLLETADAIVEGFRPGVMEKLGLGPQVCQARNQKLVYGRMTGWGQDGPLSHAAGHDINYIAVTGALDAIGTKESGPVPPLNLLGDFGGGSLYLVMGLLAALLESKNSGKGQVVDVAITDGVISLMSCIWGFKHLGMWQNGRENNALDGGAHYYDTYECADGKWISVGSIEPQFYALLMEKLGIKGAEEDAEVDFLAQFDRSQWPERKAQISTLFKTKSQSEWCAIMEGTDVCFAPVISMDEAIDYPHNVARKSFVERDGYIQPAPAPRFSRTGAEIQNSPVAPGANTDELLTELGLDSKLIEQLKAKAAIA